MKHCFTIDFLPKISHVLATLIISDNEFLEQLTHLFLKKCTETVSVWLWQQELPGLCFRLLKPAHPSEHTFHQGEQGAPFAFLRSAYQSKAGTDHTGGARAKQCLQTQLCLPGMLERLNVSRPKE